MWHFHGDVIFEWPLRKNLVNSNLGDKTSLQLYLNIVRNLTLRYLCFLTKAIKTVFMLCFNQFLLLILNRVFCVFYTLLLILMFPKHI